jgi:hypothetical protein
MTKESPLRFRCGDLELDGLVALPGGATTGCVVCHPHPLYGGDMRNNVVSGVTAALAAAGVATLRFDFRGVGRSGGTHGGGVAEIDDLRSAIAALKDASGLARIVPAGYSFGSMVALRLASTEAAIPAVVAIAPPLSMTDWSFALAIRAPMLAVAGDRDPFCSPTDFDRLAASRPGIRAVRLASADHFFGGREAEVAGEVVRFVSGA